VSGVYDERGLAGCYARGVDCRPQRTCAKGNLQYLVGRWRTTYGYTTIDGIGTASSEKLRPVRCKEGRLLFFVHQRSRPTRLAAARQNVRLLNLEIQLSQWKFEIPRKHCRGALCRQAPCQHDEVRVCVGGYDRAASYRWNVTAQTSLIRAALKL
jgi:hypothetical protein